MDLNGQKLVQGTAEFLMALILQRALNNQHRIDFCTDL